MLILQSWNIIVDDLQSIPRESNDKDVVIILVELIIEANEEYIVIVLQHGGNDVTWKQSIDGLQSPRESNDKDVAATSDELTIEADEESFVIVLQHGGNDVTWKQSILTIQFWQQCRGI